MEFPPACLEDFSWREFYGGGLAGGPGGSVSGDGITCGLPETRTPAFVPPENRVYVGDNLTVMGALAGEFAGKVDCVYIDPPYNSHADYVAEISLHGGSGQKRRRKQYGDCWNDSEYLQFMYDRLVALRELLAETGSIFLHCDWHAAAVLRLVCDEVFGAKNLLNEIVWSYASGGGSKRQFGRKHDLILFYAKNARRHYFAPDAVRVPYRAAIAPKRRELFHPQGMVSPDVWDIPRPPNHAASWVGYPTQKPVEVMQRALLAACPPGGLVLDCFAGCGSTLVAAASLGRHFIGVERADLGVHLARKRLVSLGVSFGVWRGASGAFPVPCPQVKTELMDKAALLGFQVSDWRELVDWAVVDPGFTGGVFAPARFDIPPQADLVRTPGLVSPDSCRPGSASGLVSRGLAMVTDVTGRDFFVLPETV